MRERELAQQDLRTVYEFGDRPDVSSPRKRARKLVWAFGSAGLVLAFLTAVGECGGAEPGSKQPSDTGNNVPKVERDLPKESEMILPLRHKSDPSKPVYFKGGPHRTDLSRANAPWDAIDLGTAEGGRCPLPPLIDWVVVTPADGVVKEAGKPGARNQSVVKIDHGNGLETTLVHLANIKVKEGQKVKQGQELGNPSCEVPAGGKATGPHAHAAFARNDQPVVEKMVLSGWQFESTGREYQGIARRSGEQLRIADERSCGPTDKSIQDCGNIRNDLAPGAAVRAKTASPTPQAKTSEPRAKTPESKVGDLTNPKEVGKQAIQALIDRDVDKFLQYVRPDNRESFSSDVTIKSALEDTEGCSLKGAEILEEDVYFITVGKAVTVVFKERCAQREGFLRGTTISTRSCMVVLSRINNRWYLEDPQIQCHGTTVQSGTPSRPESTITPTSVPREFINPCHGQDQYRPDYLTEKEIAAACQSLLMPKGLDRNDPKNQRKVEDITSWYDPQLREFPGCKFTIYSQFEEQGVRIDSSITFCQTSQEAGKLLRSDDFARGVEILPSQEKNIPQLGDEMQAIRTRYIGQISPSQVLGWRRGKVVAAVQINADDFGLLVRFAQEQDKSMRDAGLAR